MITMKELRERFPHEGALLLFAAIRERDAHIRKQDAALAEAREALEFYCHEDTYAHFDSELPPNIVPDHEGDRAREWLAAHPAKET